MNNKVVIKNKIKKILKIQIQIIFSGKNKNKINGYKYLKKKIQINKMINRICML